MAGLRAPRLVDLLACTARGGSSHTRALDAGGDTGDGRVECF
jgi:hypothetical protein